MKSKWGHLPHPVRMFENRAPVNASTMVGSLDNGEPEMNDMESDISICLFSPYCFYRR